MEDDRGVHGDHELAVGEDPVAGPAARVLEPPQPLLADRVDRRAAWRRTGRCSAAHLGDQARSPRRGRSGPVGSTSRALPAITIPKTNMPTATSGQRHRGPQEGAGPAREAPRRRARGAPGSGRPRRSGTRGRRSPAARRSRSRPSRRCGCRRRSASGPPAGRRRSPARARRAPPAPARRRPAAGEAAKDRAARQGASILIGPRPAPDARPLPRPDRRLRERRDLNTRARLATRADPILAAP